MRWTTPEYGRPTDRRDKRFRRVRDLLDLASTNGPRSALQTMQLAPQRSECALNSALLDLQQQRFELIISDLGMSHETGRGTDFIVLTR